MAVQVRNTSGLALQRGADLANIPTRMPRVGALGTSWVLIWFSSFCVIVAVMESTVSSIAQAIREKQARLESLEAEAALLRAELDEIREALQIEMRSVRRSTRVSQRTARVRPVPVGSAASRAYEVLRLRGEPTHVDVLLTAIEAEQNVRLKRDTLVGQLSRYVKRQHTFSREGRNVFGLREWKMKRGADGAAASDVEAAQPAQSQP